MRAQRWMAMVAAGLVLVGGACSSDDASNSSSGSDSSSSANVKPSVKALCDLIIEKQTAAGVMKNKTYISSALEDPDKMKAIAKDTVKYKDRALALAPAEIKADLEKQIDVIIARVKGDDKAKLDPEVDKRVLAFQKDKCGITLPGS